MTVQAMFPVIQYYGRCLEEYLSMFGLNKNDLTGKNILDVPGGPASFGAEALQLGARVTSCDPLYVDSVAEMQTKVRNAYRTALKFILHKGESKLDLATGQHNTPGYRAMRRATFRSFMQDYPRGRREGRYITAALPKLPFENGQFDLVLSGNLLFLYSDEEAGGALKKSPLDYRFHLQSLLEMCRVAREVRIYPLQASPVKHAYLPGLLKDLTTFGKKSEVIPVSYRDIAGAIEMLRIW